MTISYSQMTKYEMDPVEEALPTMMSWDFDEISQGPCAICGFRSAHSGSIVQYCPQHMANNVSHDGGFHGQLYTPNSAQAFLEPRMPYQYQINQILQSSVPSTSCSQHDDYKITSHPISPISEYGPSITSSKTADVEEGYTHLPPDLRVAHQNQNNISKETYFPPNNFVLTSSSSVPSFLSISFDSPISTPYQSPVKHEEEEYLETSTAKVYAPNMTAEQPTTIDDFMSQDTEAEEGSQDLSLENIGDNRGPQEDNQAPKKSTESDLPNNGEQFLDGIQVVPTYSDTDPETDKTAPYAVLIHRALMSSPEKKMVLADIYDYFREKIPRFKRVKGRGWMNSIRHNLSMNGAFLKQDRPPDDPGKGYIWVLSDEAIKGGVKSTTRYRKSPPGSKKRTADELFPRGGVGRRRRKSTRNKWAAQTGRNRPGSEQTLHEEIETPHTPIFHYDNVALPDCIEEPMVDYGLASHEHHSNIHNTINRECFESLTIKDYANCYPSFPHPGMSNRLYIHDSDDDLCLEGPHGFANQFRDQFALVTSAQIAGCQSTN